MTAAPPEPSGRPVGRVFRRSLDPDPPVAVEGRGSTIRDADGREYLDAAGGAIVVNVGHGRRVDRPTSWRTRRPGSPTPTAPRSRPSRSRRTPRAVGPHLPVDDPAIYPVSGGSEAIETRAEARPRLPPRPRRDRPLDRHRALGELPRQHARRARPVGPPAAPPAVRGLARPVPARLAPPTRTAPASPAPTPSATPSELAAELDRAIEAAGPGTVAAFVAEPIVGATLARRRPAGRLLAGDRRGLPPPRRPAHRRRGDDRVRADRALVRARPLGRPAGHPRRGQGRDVRLLAVRVRRRVRRGPRRRHRAPAGSSTASRTRTRRSARPSPARCSGSSRTRTSSRPARRRASGSGPAPRAARRPSQRRRDPRPGPDGRHRARRRPRDARAVPARRPPDRGDRPGGPRAAASCSTRGPATRTASTATRSCSARRSSSPTTSSSRIADAVADAVADADGDRRAATAAAGPAEAPASARRSRRAAARRSRRGSAAARCRQMSGWQDLRRRRAATRIDAPHQPASPSRRRATPGRPR